jgi:putative IMPACT (imprinted ancient) family translation regulator
MEIFSGPALLDRKSTFQAHCTFDIACEDDAKTFMEQLRSKNSKINKATHNILAYKTDGRNTGHDSDGETSAGRGLETLVESIKYEPAVAVCVSRWYGGVHLGSERFRIINKVARELIASKKGRNRKS